MTPLRSNNGHVFGDDLRCGNKDEHGTVCGYPIEDGERFPERCCSPREDLKRCVENVGDAIEGDRTTGGIRGIAANMIAFAIAELLAREPKDTSAKVTWRKNRADARNYVFSRDSYMETHCRWLGLSPEAIREGIRRKMHDRMAA